MNAEPRLRLSGTNLERAADHNQRMALHAIRVSGSLTRVEIANVTGLTPPAIANITKRLLAEGLIAEAGRRRGGRGQPPTRLVINPNACFAIGVNIDRDHITLVLVNFLGETIARRSCEAGFALPADVRAFYVDSVEHMIAEAGIDPARIVGIGIARPDDLGSVDLPGRPASYAEWESADLPDLVAAPFPLPVFVENDSAAAAMGEQQLGLGQHLPSFFYILVSWGLGGGLVIDGSYFRGANGRSGEIGFLPAGTGQIQNSVSLAGLARALEGRALDAPESAGTVERWIDEAAETLADALIAVNCLIDPAAVLIGGRLPGRHLDRLAERLEATVRARGAGLPAIAPVRRAMLAEDAPAVGGAILPFSHFLLPRPNALWKAPETAGQDPAEPVPA